MDLDFTARLDPGLLSRRRGGTKLSEQMNVHVVNLREFATNSYGSVDDAPYGGGGGAVIRADVLEKALSSLGDKGNQRLIVPSARGQKWNAQAARSFVQAEWQDLVFICGRYEGIDERFFQAYACEEFSLGDYVLNGGELAALTMIDSAFRFFPGVLGNQNSSAEDSFEQGLLDHPHYTRPVEWKGLKTPEVLLSGHAQNIQEFRQQQRMKQTEKWRPDLLKGKK